MKRWIAVFCAAGIAAATADREQAAAQAEAARRASDEAAEAHALMESSEHIGKIVLLT